MILQVYCFLMMLFNFALAAPGQGGARNNIMRLAREDKTMHVHADFNGADVVRSLLNARSLNSLGGGELIRILDPLTGGQMLRSLEQLANGQYLGSLDNFRGGEVLGVLDRLTGGDLIGSLDGVEGTSVLGVLERARQIKSRHPPSPKRTQTLDTLNGMAFGMSKRFDSLSGSTFGLSKRDFDEIDNVGFTGFAKRGPYSHNRLALAKKNFDEIDRAGFETYNKRNFDEIDRAGFETFEKRDRKE